MSVKLIKEMNLTFEKLNASVDRLKKNIEYTDFKDKIKIALPISLTSSALTLLIYLLIGYFLKWY